MKLLENNDDVISDESASYALPKKYRGKTIMVKIILIMQLECRLNILVNILSCSAFSMWRGRLKVRAALSTRNDDQEDYSIFKFVE